MYDGAKVRARILAIDLGRKRTGIAISDPLGITAQGLETFRSGPGRSLVDHVKGLVEEYYVELVVIGMPLSMSGEEIEGSERSRALAKAIMERVGVKTVLADERMSSLESERVIREAGKVRDKGDIDKVSAVLILQGYLDGISGR
jgi:putative Holliday junction resolvase